MATSFNLGGLLGIDDGLGDLLTPAQRQSIEQRGLLSAAAALLQASGPSATRTNLGQALGSALLAGQTGAEQAQQSALTQMLTRQKVEEARREAEAAQNWQRLFGTDAAPAVARAEAAQVPAAITPEQALAATGMQAGPTTARAAMIGQPMPAAQAASAAAPAAANVMSLLTPEQRAIIAAMKPQQGMQELMRISAQAAEFGPEQTVIRNGKPVVVRVNKLGQEQVVQGASPVEAYRFGEARMAVRGGKPVMVRTNQFGEEQVVEGAAPPESLQFGRAEPAVRDGQVVMVQTNPFGEERIVPGAMALGAVTFGEAKLAVRGGKPVMIRTNQFGEEQIVEGAAPPESLQFGRAEPAIRNGQAVMVQTNPFGEERIVAGAAPYQAPPSDIIATEYIRGSSLAGTGQPGMAAVGQYRQQIAPRTQVDVRLPGNQQFLAGVGTDIAQTLGNLTQAARAATDTLTTIERIRPAISEAVVGPAADYRTTMLRIGQQLGVAGQNENERLANTRTLVQGLAQLELEAASAMRGQGALTEGERGILRRAAAGDQTLSAPELRSALNAAEKVANRRIQTQKDYLESAKKLPGFEQFAPLYQITPPPPAGAGAGAGPSNLLNAIDAAIQGRRGQQQQQPQRGR